MAPSKTTRALRKSADNSPVSAPAMSALAYVIKRDRQDPPASEQLADPFHGLYGEGVALVPPLPFHLLLQLVEENAIHSACVRAKAMDAAGRGWTFQARDEDDTVSDEDVADLNDILEDITPGRSFSEMLAQVAQEQEALGWAAWEVQRDRGDDEIAAIYPLPGQTLRATLEKDVYVQMRGGRIMYFVEFGSKKVGRVHRDIGYVKQGQEAPPRVKWAPEVITFKEYTPRSLYYGVPNWIAVIPTIAELTAIREFNVSWFHSGGQSDRSLHVTAKDLPAAARLIDDIKTQMSDARGMKHSTVLTAGTEDVKVTVSQLDVQTKEGHFRLRRTDLVKEVLMGHSVPAFRVGWADLGPVHKDTEVLTLTGWEKITDVHLGNRVATMNLETNKLEFQPVQRRIRKHYDHLIEFANERRFALQVSGDHRMWAMRCSTPRKQRYRWYTAEEMAATFERAKHVKFMLPCAGDLAGPFRGPSVDEAALMGWLVSEGSLRYRRGQGYEVSLFQKDGPKAEEIRLLLKRLRIDFAESEMTSAGRTFNGRQIVDSSVQCFRLHNPEKRRWYGRMRGVKRVPREMFHASPAARAAFIDAAIEGDGSRCGPSLFYYSADRVLADQIAAICTLTGQVAWVQERPDRKGQYVVHIKRPNSPTHRQVKRMRRVPYGDYAYCLTVPNGTVVYRWQGHPYIAGNSLGGGSHAAEEMLDAYRYGVVRPKQVMLADRLNNTLFGPKGLNLRRRGMRFDLNELDFGELRAQIDVASRAVQNGIFSPNEGRVQIGKKKRDGMPELDKHYLNYLPIEQAGAESPRDPAAPAGAGQHQTGPTGDAPPKMPPATGNGNGHQPAPVAASAVTDPQHVIEMFTSALRAALRDEPTAALPASLLEDATPHTPPAAIRKDVGEPDPETAREVRELAATVEASLIENYEIMRSVLTRLDAIQRAPVVPHQIIVERSDVNVAASPAPNVTVPVTLNVPPAAAARRRIEYDAVTHRPSHLVDEPAEAPVDPPAAEPPLPVDPPDAAA